MPRRQLSKPLIITSYPWKVQIPFPPVQEWIDNGITVGVISSCVASITYDKPNATLIVEFQGKGVAPNVRYAYYFVPELEARSMYFASSMGIFVHRRLEPYFPHQPIP